MRTDNRSLVLATLGGLSTALACTLITDVDRQKIKPPANQAGDAGSAGSGGSAGKGGRGGDGGSGGSAGSTGGTAPQGGQAGEAGEAGAPSTGGTSSVGGTAGMDLGGAGGEAGAVAVCGNGVMESGEACDDGNTSFCGTCTADCSAVNDIPTGEDASITIGDGTNIADGDTFTIDDGSNTVVFEFECDVAAGCVVGSTGVASGNVAVPFDNTYFDGMNDAAEYVTLIVGAINGSSLASNATDAASSPAMLSITGVETLSDTVGAPTFVPAVRCRATRGCSGDNVCLSNACTSGECE